VATTDYTDEKDKVSFVFSGTAAPKASFAASFCLRPPGQSYWAVF